MLPSAILDKPACFHAKSSSSGLEALAATTRGPSTTMASYLCFAPNLHGRTLASSLHLLAKEKRKLHVRSKLFVALAMGHPESEITTIQELADGSFLFRFGASSTNGSSSKGHELSSSHAEHISSRLIPALSRLPSCFKKQSPIPLSAVSKTRHLGGSGSKDSKGDTDVSEPARNFKERSKRTSRPRSSFVKKTPVTPRKMETVSQEHSLGSGVTSSISTEHDLSVSSQPLMSLSNTGELNKKKGSRVRSSTQASENAGIEKSEKRKVLKEAVSKRPASKFVRRSPVPSSTGKVTVKSVSRAIKSRQNGLMDPSTGHVDLRSSRPKSNFVKRSPIPLIPTSRLKTDEVIGNVSEQDSQSILSSFGVNVVGMQQESNITSGENKEAKVAKAEQIVSSGAGLPADLDQCTLVELRNIAKSQGLKGYSRLKKAELLQLLRESASSGKNE